jgi:3-dehydroquinate synthase
VPAGAPMIVPGGENAKNGWSGVREIMTRAGCEHLDRQSYIIAVGGGALLDMAGFAASLVHRGVRLVRLPSTVLAQNDAGIGVKNGMNEGGAKNFAGTFAPPYAVINDLDLLDTLPLRHWTGGAAEAFKVALIADRDFFEWLCANAHLVAARDRRVMEQLVYRTAALHLSHIAGSGDPFETGSARPLDFGHWAGHRLELISNFALSHGEAVAIGIALDCTYAMLAGYIGESECHAAVAAMRRCGLPVRSELLQRLDSAGEPDVLRGLDQFREHLGGELCVTLPCPAGSRIEVSRMDRSLLKEALRRVCACETAATDSAQARSPSCPPSARPFSATRSATPSSGEFPPGNGGFG